MAPQAHQIEEPLDAELAQRQAVAYGKDLARVYVAEKAKREELEVAYQALRAIFAAVPDGLVALNDDLTIAQANASFSRLVEIPLEALAGRALHDVLPADSLFEVLANAQGSTEPIQHEFWLNLSGKRSIAVQISPLHSGRAKGWVILLHDQTQKKQLERQKSDFVNIAAHELRTPLTSILGNAEMLSLEAAEFLPDPLQEVLGAVIRGTQRLKQTVTELLQFAELNVGQLTQDEIITFSLSDLVFDIGADLWSYLKKNSISFQVDVPLELNVTANQYLLREALHQLCINGVLYNRPGGYVQVNASTEVDQIRITVQDSGIGISTHDLQAIFEPFFQLQSSSTRSVGGLGLGLTIVQKAVSALGGKISVASKVGEGTQFTIELPLKPPKENTEAADIQTELDISYRQTLAYARDIQALYQQLKKVNQQLQETNQRLEEANKLKSGFLGVVSHELRSPFASIDFALQAFSRYGLEWLTPDQRDLMTQITDKFKEARTMIDNLVNYAGLLSKQGHLQLEVVNVTTLIHETAAMLRPMAESHGLNWQVDVADDLILDSGDRALLVDALWHLMHNAIKFTKPDGGVITRAYAENNQLHFEVEDTGIGIPAEKQAGLWQDFFQLSDPLKRGTEGLGLGLALVRYVAVAHRGQVYLRSEVGHGTTVGFMIPCEA